MSTATNTLFDVMTLGNFLRVANVLSDASEAAQSQYSASTQLRKFARMLHEDLGAEEFDKFIRSNYFDLHSATGVGLDSIASRVGVSRRVFLSTGEKVDLSDDQLRALILFKALANIGNASIRSIQSGLDLLFGGAVKVLDNGDMTLTVIVTSPLTSVQLWLLKTYGLVQRGGGVGYRIQGTFSPIFGFRGQNLSTFNVGVFNFEL